MSYNVMGDLVLIANDSMTVPKLDAATYLICFNDRIGYHLKKVEPLKLPSKVYGDNPDLVEKVLKLFEDEVGRTSGVMLYGEKGTGKTMTAVGACIEANERGYPVLLLQSQFYGSDFNDFMAKIEDSCLVFIDEFEKVFDTQDSINQTLMLLDGAVKTHKLFILTSNSALETSDSMKYLVNRPSRVFYSIYYGTMEDSVIQEYLDDNLQYQNYREDIVALKRSFKIFTIDILKAIVAEINRYGHTEKPFTQLINHLNVKTDRGIKDYSYVITLKIDGKEYLASEVVSDDYLWRVTGRALENIVTSEGFDDEFQWKCLIPIAKADPEVLIPKLNKNPLVRYPDTYSEHNQVDGRVEEVVLGTKFHLSVHRHQYLNGLIEAVQDKKTRAITLKSTQGVDLEVTFTPIIQAAKKIEDFVI